MELDIKGDNLTPAVVEAFRDRLRCALLRFGQCVPHVTAQGGDAYGGADKRYQTMVRPESSEWVFIGARDRARLHFGQRPHFSGGRGTSWA